MIYANFESVLFLQNGCRNSVKKSWTKKRQLYKPCGAALYVKSSDPCFFLNQLFFLVKMYEFLDHVISIANEIRDFLDNKIKTEELTALQEEEFLSATMCQICGKSFSHQDKHIKYHDHLTGKNHGPVHNACNLQYRIKPKDIKILCIMHNLCSYNPHPIMSVVEPRHRDISVLPNADEKYTPIKIGQVTFIDSFQFVPSSLDSLSKNQADDQYKEISKSNYGGKVSLKDYIIKITKRSM